MELGKIAAVEPPSGELLAPALRPLADHLLPLAFKLPVAGWAVPPFESGVGHLILAGRTGGQVNHQPDAPLVKRFIEVRHPCRGASTWWAGSPVMRPYAAFGGR
jgi:hypothetical protein